MEKLAIEGKIEGKRARGRQRLIYTGAKQWLLRRVLKTEKGFKNCSPKLESYKALQE